jgi:hypothetical protein
MSERTPELTRVKGGWSVRIRCGKGQKPRFLLRVEDENTARARAATMTELARLLVAAGKVSEAPVVLRELAEQSMLTGTRTRGNSVKFTGEDRATPVKNAARGGEVHR